MGHPEVPLEQSQEHLMHEAEGSSERWVMKVALTAALLAVLAAIAALMAEHHANEAMIHQIQASDQWNYYQAKGIKANLLGTKNELLAGLGKTIDPKDEQKLEEYRKQQAEIKAAAEEKEHESQAHLRHHTILSRSLTMLQVGIAISAIAVLTKRRKFWGVAVAFGLAGLVFFVWGLAG